MTIGEHIKAHQPYMLAIIMRIYCLGPYRIPPKFRNLTEDDVSPFYDRLMREIPGFVERLPR